MRVVFVTEGIPSTQSVVHRVEYTKESLMARGDHVEVLYGTDGVLLGHRFQRASLVSTVKGLLALGDVDALIIHRASDPLTGLIASMGKKRGVPILFDLDDAIYLRWNVLSAWAHRLIRTSDAVTAGSHALAQYSRELNSNVHLVPSPVDTESFRPPQVRERNDVPIIGWMGDGRVHGENLAMIVNPLLELATQVKFELKLVSALGNTRVVNAFGPLEDLVEVDYGPNVWVDIKKIPSLMANFDISVMPLGDTEFNRCKGGQKLLESMAMEIPVVASPVGENNYIVSHGDDGFLARTAAEWKDYLGVLVRDSALRVRMGKRGHQKIVARYSREVSFKLFSSALASAINGNRSGW